MKPTMIISTIVPFFCLEDAYTGKLKFLMGHTNLLYDAKDIFYYALNHMQGSRSKRHIYDLHFYPQSYDQQASRIYCSYEKCQVVMNKKDQELMFLQDMFGDDPMSADDIIKQAFDRLRVHGTGINLQAHYLGLVRGYDPKNAYEDGILDGVKAQVAEEVLSTVYDKHKDDVPDIQISNTDIQ